MYHFYNKIGESELAEIQKYENQQLLRFKSEYDNLCVSISNKYDCNYSVNVCRWIDTTVNWHSKQYDGYTATLQVEFADSNGRTIEIDECICSFFENITFISFNPILRRYKVFQNDSLMNIRKEIQDFLQQFDKAQ